MVDRRSTVATQNGVDVSQCYVGAATTANSVNIIVTEKTNGSDAQDPRRTWEQIFGEGAKEQSGEHAKSEKIQGVGDEAYWRGAPIGSSLYALKGNAYVRVSVGGGDSGESKLEKSKKVAELILSRL